MTIPKSYNDTSFSKDTKPTTHNSIKDRPMLSPYTPNEDYQSRPKALSEKF